MSADRQGLKPDEQNPVLGELHATTPVSGQVTLDLAEPGPGWRVTTPLALPTEPSKGVIVTARHESAHTEMRQSDATIAQIRALAPGQVLVMGEPGQASRVVSVQQFHRDACAG